MPTDGIAASMVYVSRIQQTRMPGFNHVWFRCEGCDLQGDMTGTNEETDEVLAVLGDAHAERHKTEARARSRQVDPRENRHMSTEPGGLAN